MQIGYANSSLSNWFIWLVTDDWKFPAISTDLQPIPRLDLEVLIQRF